MWICRQIVDEYLGLVDDSAVAILPHAADAMPAPTRRLVLLDHRSESTAVCPDPGIVRRADPAP